MDRLRERLNNPERLAALKATGLLDSPTNPNYDRLTKLISKLLGVPFSLISLVDDRRQFFISAVGTESRELPLTHSYCQYVVADEQPLAVADIREDERLKDNLAIRDFNAVAYLGVPLRSHDGQVLGALCAIDTKPRSWTPEELELVTELAQLVMSEMAAERQLRERQSVDAALDASESRLRLALAAGKMGAWDWDLQTDQVIFSDLTYDIWGVPKGEAVTGSLVFNLMHDDDVTRVEAAVQAALDNSEDFDAEWRIHRRNGEERWLVGRGSVVRDAQGQPERMLGVNYDITEKVRTREALERFNDELERRIEARTQELEVLNKELEAFNYSVSHDLRAPLRGIDGFSSALENEYGEALDETAAHYLSRVRAGAQRMGELIDDLLDLSRLSRGELRLTKVDISKLAQSIIQGLIAAELERDFRIEIAPELSATADKRLLTVALENLLGNAVKFTGTIDKPTIIFGKEDGAFFLRDNGVGFDMRYADKLFIPFQRLHTMREFEGSGIGLTTVQRIINRHGGRLWAESELGEGATFYFTLPASKS